MAVDEGGARTAEWKGLLCRVVDLRVESWVFRIYNVVRTFNPLTEGVAVMENKGVCQCIRIYYIAH